jgi:hypothetical protein
MRRSRRGHSGMEFGGSGEDSFVAVVVTKLTGALLFILLLTMVIMALLPKAVDLPSSPGEGDEAAALAVTTPGTLPEAIAGRPYELALAADGGDGHRRWTLVGELPPGMAFVPEKGLIRGTPLKGTPEPVSLTIAVADGRSRATQTTRLIVYQPDSPLSLPSKWRPSLPSVPWGQWLDHGFGFLVLWLVYWVGLSTIDGLKRRALGDETADEEIRRIARRFVAYKLVLSLAVLAASAFLVAWIWRPR